MEKITSSTSLEVGTGYLPTSVRHSSESNPTSGDSDAMFTEPRSDFNLEESDESSQISTVDSDEVVKVADSVYPSISWVRTTLRNSLYAPTRRPVLDAFIIGSEAKGTATPDSDLDIGVVIQPIRGKTALQLSEEYHSKFPTNESKPHWNNRRVDFQFFYPDDTELLSYAQIPLSSTADIISQIQPEIELGQDYRIDNSGAEFNWRPVEIGTLAEMEKKYGNIHKQGATFELFPDTLCVVMYSPSTTWPTGAATLYYVEAVESFVKEYILAMDWIDKYEPHLAVGSKTADIISQDLLQQPSVGSTWKELRGSIMHTILDVLPWKEAQNAYRNIQDNRYASPTTRIVGDSAIVVVYMNNYHGKYAESLTSFKQTHTFVSDSPFASSQFMGTTADIISQVKPPHYIADAIEAGADQGQQGNFSWHFNWTRQDPNPNLSPLLDSTRKCIADKIRVGERSGLEGIVKWRIIMHKTSDIISVHPRVSWEELRTMMKPYQIWESLDAINRGGNRYFYIEDPTFIGFGNDVRDAMFKRGIWTKVLGFVPSMATPVHVHEDKEPFQLISEDYRALPKQAAITKSVEEIAEEVQNNLMRNQDYSSDFTAQCIECSRYLAQRLRNEGYKNVYLVMGKFVIDNPDVGAYTDWNPDDFASDEEMQTEMLTPLHYWVEVDGKIVDISANQFNSELEGEAYPPIVYGEYSEYSRYIKQNVKKVADKEGQYGFVDPSGEPYYIDEEVSDDHGSIARYIVKKEFNKDLSGWDRWKQIKFLLDKGWLRTYFDNIQITDLSRSKSALVKYLRTFSPNAQVRVEIIGGRGNFGNLEFNGTADSVMQEIEFSQYGSMETTADIISNEYKAFPKNKEVWIDDKDDHREVRVVSVGKWHVLSEQYDVHDVWESLRGIPEQAHLLLQPDDIAVLYVEPSRLYTWAEKLDVFLHDYTKYRPQERTAAGSFYGWLNPEGEGFPINITGVYNNNHSAVAWTIVHADTYLTKMLPDSAYNSPFYLLLRLGWLRVYGNTIEVSDLSRAQSTLIEYVSGLQSDKTVVIDAGGDHRMFRNPQEAMEAIEQGELGSRRRVADILSQFSMPEIGQEYRPIVPVYRHGVPKHLTFKVTAIASKTELMGEKEGVHVFTPMAAHSVHIDELPVSDSTILVYGLYGSPAWGGIWMVMTLLELEEKMRLIDRRKQADIISAGMLNVGDKVYMKYYEEYHYEIVAVGTLKHLHEKYGTARRIVAFLEFDVFIVRNKGSEAVTPELFEEHGDEMGYLLSAIPSPQLSVAKTDFYLFVNMFYMNEGFPLLAPEKTADIIQPMEPLGTELPLWSKHGYTLRLHPSVDSIPYLVLHEPDGYVDHPMYEEHEQWTYYDRPEIIPDYIKVAINNWMKANYQRIQNTKEMFRQDQ